MRVVVTGGAGFVGSHLSLALADAGHDVLVADRMGAAYWPVIVGVDGLTPVILDLVVDDLAPLGLDAVDLVFHLAGRPGVRSSFGPGSAATHRDNVLATRRLLGTCLSSSGGPGGRGPAVVVASSSSVYGTAPGRPQREDDELAPVSPYGQSKKAVERLAAAAAADGLAVTSLRYFSVFGARQRADMAFHRFIEAGLDRRPLPVLGDVTRARSFTHTGDIVSGTLLAGQALVDGALPRGSIINLGSAVPSSLAEAVDVLAELLGGIEGLDLRPNPPGDVALTWADSTRAARWLGWSAGTTLAQGLADQADWHRQQRGDLAVLTVGRG